MKKIGLLFGSFNPLHNGHIILAESAIRDARLDDVCFIVQSENPYKPKFELVDYDTRLQLIQEAGLTTYQPVTRDYDHYILETLKELDDHNLVLVLGEDLAGSFAQWEDYNNIIMLAEVYESHRIDGISSGLVRDRLRAGQSVDDIVPPVVATYLKQSSR